jgi:hypothetical protein
MPEKTSAPGSATTAKSRGKYITLVLLLAWVVAVFAFTFFKFSGGTR